MAITRMNKSDFIKLPDWKKVELKRKQKNTMTFPLMTEIQEENRKLKIFFISAVFAEKNMEDLILNEESPIRYWPSFLHKVITPKLLDLPIDKIILDFGKCQSCDNFIGFNKGNPLRKNKSVISIYGNCKIAENYYINLENSCESWNPNRFSIGLLELKIKNLFPNDIDYTYENYLLDLKSIHIWDYFFDTYGK